MADLQALLLQDPPDPRPHPQIRQLRPLQLCQSAELVKLRLLGQKLRFRYFSGVLQALLLDFIPRAELLRFALRHFQAHVGNHAQLIEFLVDIRLHSRFIKIGLRLCDL